MKMSSTAVIVLNWNDADLLPHSVGSLLKQDFEFDIIVVDNGSTDGSREVIESFGDKITAIYNDDNYGFAGGINSGFRYVLDSGYDYVGFLNNDATAKKYWVKELHKACSSGKSIGGATSAIHHATEDTYDSTGDFLTVWGLSWPRGRDEPIQGQYDKKTDVFAVSGGASMYKTAMLREVGLFDEDFFAYYEDVDLGMRAQLHGWSFKFAPKAVVLHATGTTSGRVKNFGTFQALKNQPFVVIKNVPRSLLIKVVPRFILAYLMFSGRSLARGKLLTVLRAWVAVAKLTPKKLGERRVIQRYSTPAGVKNVEKLIVYDLPANATALRKLRSIMRKVFPKFV